MRRPPVPIAALPGFLAAAFLVSGAETPGLAYRFDEVKSKVRVATVAAPDVERAVAVGDSASSGDHVRTGFWGRTVVAVPEQKARFEIGSSTRAILAGGEPGVLVTLEKGRLKAIFEALTDGPFQERRVAAPGALLAVRGTRYGLEVNEGGETFLAVFEGVVEVIPRTPGFAPVSVRADEFCTFDRKTPPRPAPMRDRGMNERNWGQGPFRGPEAGRNPGSSPDGKPGQGMTGSRGSNPGPGQGSPGGPGGSPTGPPK